MALFRKHEFFFHLGVAIAAGGSAGGHAPLRTLWKTLREIALRHVRPPPDAGHRSRAFPFVVW